jgi:hypothetical protein
MLFMMTIVVGLELGVHEPVGPVPGDDEPPHDVAAMIAAAVITPAVTLLTVRMLLVSLTDRSLRF